MLYQEFKEKDYAEQYSHGKAMIIKGKNACHKIKDSVVSIILSRVQYNTGIRTN